MLYEEGHSNPSETQNETAEQDKPCFTVVKAIHAQCLDGTRPFLILGLLFV